MSAFRKDLFADVGSNITSDVYFVGDAAELTLFYDVDSATSFDIQTSNAQGFRETIAEDEWSTDTTVANVSANGMLNIEPGFRWIRLTRETESTASLPSAVVAGRNVSWGHG